MMYNGHNAEALASVYDDPALTDMLESGEWTTPDEQSGTLVHRHGARIVITGAWGRWVPLPPTGNRLGRGYFKRPSAAAARLADGGWLR